MARDASRRTADGLVRVCPSCRGKCRARAAAARRDVYCPHCGGRIRPGHTVADDESKLEDLPYAALEPAAVKAMPEPAPDQIEVAAHWREYTPAPFSLLWRGVFGFPWHPGVLRAWFLFGVGFTLVALLAAFLHFLFDLYQTQPALGRITFYVIILYIKGFVVFLVWTGAYAADYFLATVVDTAAGNEKVRWPDDSPREKVFTFFYFAWLVVCSAIPLAVAAAPLRPRYGLVVFAWSLLASVVLVFPFVLFCALTNNSVWKVWNTQVVGRMVRKPHVLLVLFLVTAALLAGCAALGYVTVWEMQYYAAPVTGFVWSACVLIHGRLLGRVGHLISGEDAADSPARKGRRGGPRRS